MSYFLITEAKPPPGTVCVVWAFNVPQIAVWSERIGPVGGGGDFATVTIGKRTTKIEHLPGVTHWQVLEPRQAIAPRERGL